MSLSGKSEGVELMGGVEGAAVEARDLGVDGGECEKMAEATCAVTADVAGQDAELARLAHLALLRALYSTHQLHRLQLQHTAPLTAPRGRHSLSQLRHHSLQTPEAALAERRKRVVTSYSHQSSSNPQHRTRHRSLQSLQHFIIHLRFHPNRFLLSQLCSRSLFPFKPPNQANAIFSSTVRQGSASNLCVKFLPGWSRKSRLIECAATFQIQYTRIGAWYLTLSHPNSSHLPTRILSRKVEHFCSSTPRLQRKRRQ